MICPYCNDSIDMDLVERVIKSDDGCSFIKSYGKCPKCKIEVEDEESKE